MKILMMAMAATTMVGATNAEASITFTAYNLDAKYNGYKILCMVYSDGNDNLDSDAIDLMNGDYLSESGWMWTDAKSWTEHYQAFASSLSPVEVIEGSGSWQYFSDGPSPIHNGRRYLLSSRMA